MTVGKVSDKNRDFTNLSRSLLVRKQQESQTVANQEELQIWKKLSMFLKEQIFQVVFKLFFPESGEQ